MREKEGGRERERERESERETRRFSNIYRELSKESQCALFVVVFDDIDVGDGVDSIILCDYMS